MDSKNILIIGNNSKYTALAHDLKKYYLFVSTKSPDLKSVSEFLERKQCDAIIISLMVEKIDAFTFLESLKELDTTVTRIVLICPYISSVIRNIANQYNYRLIEESKLNTTDLLCKIGENDVPNKQEEVPVKYLSNEQKEKMIYKKITEIIKKAGVPTNIKGYYYLRESIMLCIKNENGCLISYTNEIFPKISQKYDASFSSIDRSIRHAINVAWNTSPFIHEKMRCKPTSFQLITSIADFIKTNYLD